MCGKMLCTCCSKQNCYIFTWSKVVKQNVKCVHFAACNIDQGKSCPASEKDPYVKQNPMAMSPGFNPKVTVFTTFTLNTYSN